MLPLTLLLVATAAHAQSASPLTIEQAMADPDWIGPSVDQAWWQWDGKQVQYLLKRDGSPVRDTYRQGTGGGTAERVADTARAGLDAANPSYDATRQRMLFARNGDIFLRDLRTGTLTQLTRSNEIESRPQFASDGGAIWRAGNNWYHWRADGGTAQVAVVKAERDPNAAPKADVLREQQLATLATLRRDKEQRDALRTQEDAWRRADATRAAAPVYLGDEVEIVDSALSPDGRHLLVVTQAKSADEGQAGKMPKYVTESGYEEFQEVRTRVGRNAPAAHALWLVDVGAGTAKTLSFDPLPGISTDPLAALRKTAKRDALKGNRAVRVESDGDGSGPAVHWSDDGRNVAVEIRAVDNKDRWIASVDLDNARLQPRHRLSDSAWINWDFNDFGWLPDNRTLWLLSEESGYSQLYTVEGDGKPRQRTRGKWEVSMPVPSADGSGMFFLCNQKWPGDYEVCKLDLRNDQLTEITALNGVEGYSLSPNGQQLLVRYSGSYLPTQLAVVPAAGGQATVLTDTRTPAFKAQPWIAPQYVQVPSKHGAGTVWGKYYGPKTPEPGKQYPIVMFVHGAGYLQNVSERYTPYFREQMFHNLLVQQGYIVLDLDYRASEGYGRDWRTAIYRNMGHPELEDYLDGLDWLVATKQGDRARVGIYGGSYGGFMTYMALFRSPGTFKAGAALRPVGDWMQYNHEYTSNILNTPELDPEAYKTSSPINYAQGLRDHLLIAHGMIDDNVFFKDSVDMTQKLMELHKDNWQVAPYPLERHGFTRADSWLDEYKRILKLFNEQVKP
ncbi:peptidase S9 [Xanthomonas citri pv. fuscans]|uniref:Peptidase S9 n=1 Tax=Xanthomonas citri pv. fuscans TaxID=366649 RepID=A0AB34QBA1_XANCI|nr:MULTISPECIES: S9 family peptidase [Xanthomonas]ATS65706.1 prolyl oligopeptidase family serine peptidase [Xanthomonas citri pv. phaseoli var. fuscans]ATS72968.1 prolyl oligopeptidase family serine peptidase [Xanthomonas citri pv. phaseoli var. fuscans]ATS75804.1 prolyl oligopeptidase family serine peptidase [Xanthomonas citri pv. phaseoli var. fuscans]ATS81854.1 prolyl oligopeptidase family serine peptidase [Xanthomonas citri pv. phaseoli var. fuscans]ATS87861.1 prolyl oligopeptidase family 